MEILLGDLHLLRQWVGLAEEYMRLEGNQRIELQIERLEMLSDDLPVEIIQIDKADSLTASRTSSILSKCLSPGNGN